jgi:glucuronokinase
MSGDWGRLHEVTNENFELRKTIMPIAPENQRMIDVARSVGASAKFAGSGGAICGVFHGEDQFNNLSAALAGIGCTTIKPTIFP